RLLKVSLEAGFDKVRQHLRIRCRFETMSGRGEPASQFHVILDNAVVYDDEVSRAVPMGMRILFGRLPVGCPTCVSYAAHRPFYRDTTVPQFLFERADAANGTHDVRRTSIHESDPARVITAVFEPFQRVDKDR